jgi:hypothetical protein
MLCPMPVPPPVTRAVLFLRCNIRFLFYDGHKPWAVVEYAAKIKIIPSCWDNQYIYYFCGSKNLDVGSALRQAQGL